MRYTAQKSIIIRTLARALPMFVLAVVIGATGCPSSGNPSPGPVTQIKDLGAAPIRVNSGGSGFVDSSGNSWLDDTNFNTGNTTSISDAIIGAPDGRPYQTERWDPAGGTELMYSFILDPGVYTVRLHFAETYFGASQIGQRVFDVLIEGQLVLDDFDKAATAGYRAAIVEEIEVTLVDEMLNIQFLHGVENPTISGIEIVNGPIMALALEATPSSIEFGDIEVGAVSGKQTVTLNNSGNMPLDITGISIQGTNNLDFTSDAASGYTIDPGLSAAFDVTFGPSGVGSRSASLVVDFDYAGSPKIIPLWGTGLAPVAQVSVNTIDFGSVFTGTTSAATSVSITNVGNQTLQVSSIGFTGSNPADFGSTAAASYSIAPSATETFDVTFTPATEGTRNANLTIISNDPASPANVSLGGTGAIPQPPSAEVSPVAIDFGTVAVDTTSGPQAVTITNTGDLTLNVSGVSASGEFTTSAATPYAIAPGAIVSFNVTFAPTSEGAAAGQINVTSNDPAGAATVLLSGQGVVVEAPTAALNPTVHNFGTIRVTENSAPVSVTLSNTGDDVLEVSSVGIGGANASDFSSDALGAYSIPVGQSVGFNVTFTPTTFGARSANLSVISNDPNSPAVLALSGTGTDAQFTTSPSNASFGSVEVTTISPATTVTVTNDDVVSHELHLVEIVGTNPNDFLNSSSPTLPLTLAAGASAAVGVSFAPTAIGPRHADLKFHFDNHTHHAFATLKGTGVITAPPPTGEALYRINVGGSAYVDTLGNTWAQDGQYFNTGNLFSVNAPIAGTNDDVLYQTERWDNAPAPELKYSLPIANGSYDVRLHFAEIFSGAAIPGKRTFNVLIEDQTALANYDVYSMAGFETAIVESLPVTVVDGAVDIEFIHINENPKINAIEVLAAGGLSSDVTLLEWGHVGVGATGDVINVTLTNTRNDDATITSLGFNINQGVGRDFNATLGGTTYAGDTNDIYHATSTIVPPGESIVVPVQFLPTEESGNDVSLVFGGNFGPVTVRLVGTGGEDTGHPFLHVVIVTDPYVVDFDGNGSEPVNLVGAFSHTHELNHALTVFEWTEGGNQFSTAQDVNTPFSVGDHTVTLTIYDDNVPPEVLSGSETFRVVPPTAVPGALALYYSAGGAGGANAFLDSVPTNAEFAETLPDGLTIANESGSVGGSPFATFVMVQMQATIDIDTAANYTFIANGGNESRLFLNGSPVSGPIALSPGLHDIDARFAVDSVSELPISVTYAINGGAQMPIDALMLAHDEASIKPVINSMPSSGLEFGGAVINITGLGFFPSNQVTVHWGGQDLSGSALTVTPTQITLTTPAGTGTVPVTVETPNGVSNGVTYTYNSDGPAPVQFNLSDLIGGMDDVTAGTIGSDGRLYVSEIDGTIFAYTFDENHQVTDTQTITALEGFSNPNILGLATSPFEAPGVVKLYIAHSLLFANGGSCFNDFSPYSGQITVLTGPNFNNPQPVITGLPVSNHDHAINGIEFDDNGFLLISVGGNTNAGVLHCNIGGTDESPLSAAILRANVFRPGFNGVVNHIDPATCNINNDQTYGGSVHVEHGADVEVFASGVRNGLDIVYTTAGNLYSTDNGANTGFGDISTGPNSKSSLPANQDDELNFIDIGRYYGSANRNRGVNDQRQNIYRFPADSSIEGDYEEPIATFTPSTNGLIEYRSNTFNGGLRGELIAQKWNGKTLRIGLSADGKSATSNTTLFTNFSVLNLVEAPGGVIFGIDYTSNKVMKAIPNDVAVSGLTVYDIFPWRAPATGGQEFTISGHNFGTLGNTSVTIGGVQATLFEVTSKRITGTLPSGTAGPDLLDVTVTVGANAQTLTDAFRYLRTPATDYGAQARFFVDPGGSILQSSTYGFGSFNLVNESTGGQKITRFRIDNSDAIVPDAAYDPYAAAGDPVGKDFTKDNGPMQVLSHTWFNPHDEGFDVLEVECANFAPGQTLRFSADIDPTNIKGAPQPGPNDSGSVSGLELTGAHVYVEFDDGSIVEGRLFASPGSEVASSTTAMFEGAPPAPSIEVSGVCSPTNVSNANQTVTVAGPPGYGVRLLHAESGQYLNGVPGGGFDVEPFEHNTIIDVTHISSTIGGSGSVNIPETLTKSGSEAGYNVFSAVLVDAQGNEGATSQTLVLKLN